MKYRMTFQQHAIVEVKYRLDVPDDVVAQGEDAVKDYCIDHEVDAQETDYNIIDWEDCVTGTHEVEEV